MKKFILLAAACLAAMMPATAQDVSFDSQNETYLGLRLGLDVSCPSDMTVDMGKSGKLSVPMFNNGAGFDLGAVLNMPLWKNLYFEPGLSIYYNTMGIDIDKASDIEIEKLDGSVRRFGFRMPFQVGYHADFSNFSLAVFTGPVLTVGVVGRAHYSAVEGGVKASDSESIYGDKGFMNRVDLGWKIGAGVTFDRWVLQLSGTIGMLDMNKADGVKMHDNNVALTLGYNFSL